MNVMQKVSFILAHRRLYSLHIPNEAQQTLLRQSTMTAGSYYQIKYVIATMAAILLAQCHGIPCLAYSYANPKPIDPRSWPDKFPAKNHCSKCGLCETTLVTHVANACAFLGDGMKRNIDGLESVIHGRRRNIEENDDGVADEARFGVMLSPMFLARGKGIKNAQWTGCVTSIAVSMLESGMVDAVICIASDDESADGWSNPKPILAQTVEDVLRGRGVKPALAPSLNVLDELRASPDIKKLLFCGVGCAVQGKLTFFFIRSPLTL